LAPAATAACILSICCMEVPNGPQTAKCLKCNSCLIWLANSSEHSLLAASVSHLNRLRTLLMLTSCLLSPAAGVSDEGVGAINNVPHAVPPTPHASRYAAGVSRPNTPPQLQGMWPAAQHLNHPGGHPPPYRTPEFSVHDTQVAGELSSVFAIGVGSTACSTPLLACL
jgi:hypothetical protein